jgi:hypothetical protein
VSARWLYPVLWVAVFVASAVGTYLFVRSMIAPEPPNPTRDRIQALIDEADQLRRTLVEDQRHG